MTALLFVLAFVCVTASATTALLLHDVHKAESELRETRARLYSAQLLVRLLCDPAAVHPSDEVGTDE